MPHFSRFISSLALAVGVALGVCAAPPDVPKELKVDPGQLVRVVVKGDKIGTARNFDDTQAFFDELAPQPGTRRYVFQATKPGVYVVSFWTVGEDYGVSTTITVGTPIPPTPPIPPGPIPPGPMPNPGPVTSFHVVLIFESGDTLTPAQRAVIYGRAVEDYLTGVCTDGVKGWRRRDKDAPGEADPTMAALWAAVQPKITTTPAVAVEVNGKVEIIPLDATPAAMVATLKKYREGK